MCMGAGIFLIDGPSPGGALSNGFSRGNTYAPLRHSGKRPIKVGKQPTKLSGAPINANGIKRPIKRSMTVAGGEDHNLQTPFFTPVRILALET